MNDGTRKPSMRVGFLSGFMALVAGNGTALAQDAARTDGGRDSRHPPHTQHCVLDTRNEEPRTRRSQPVHGVGSRAHAE
jgi:hypothetical protein